MQGLKSKGLNLNKLFDPKNKFNYHSKDMNTRSKLDTGYLCNYKCSFCYYIDKLDQTTPFEKIKERIDKLKKVGIKELDLSGGESSYHPDFFKILKYIQDIGLRSSTLSNGFMFSSMSFLKKSKEYGLKEILFSLHGWDKESHDSKVHYEGAFDKILKAINNCIEMDIIIRINITVQNDFNEVKYLELLNRIGIQNIKVLNFLPLNYWEKSSTLKNINYNIISKKIQNIIDSIEDMDINVRYIPLCFMKGYEDYVVGIYQHIIDKNDWNIETYDNDHLPEHITINGALKKAHNNRLISFIKPKTCLGCIKIDECDGIEYKLLESHKDDIKTRKEI